MWRATKRCPTLKLVRGKVWRAQALRPTSHIRDDRHKVISTGVFKGELRLTSAVDVSASHKGSLLPPGREPVFYWRPFTALRLWRETQSYYVLLEIVEGIIEPQIGRLRRTDIEQVLGKGDPNYPNSQGRMLHYAGERRIPQGSHVLIEFDEKGIVKDLGWVSE